MPSGFQDCTNLRTPCKPFKPERNRPEHLPYTAVPEKAGHPRVPLRIKEPRNNLRGISTQE